MAVSFLCLCGHLGSAQACACLELSSELAAIPQIKYFKRSIPTNQKPTRRPDTQGLNLSLLLLRDGSVKDALPKVRDSGLTELKGKKETHNLYQADCHTYELSGHSFFLKGSAESALPSRLLYPGHGRQIVRVQAHEPFDFRRMVIFVAST